MACYGQNHADPADDDEFALEPDTFSYVSNSTCLRRTLVRLEHYDLPARFELCEDCWNETGFDYEEVCGLCERFMIDQGFDVSYCRCCVDEVAKRLARKGKGDDDGREAAACGWEHAVSCERAGCRLCQRLRVSLAAKRGRRK